VTPGHRSDEAGSLTSEGELARGFLTQVGARIRALRTSRSLTVQQLADRAQISRRLLTQIELGQANPSLVAVTRIARQLGTEFTDLLDATTAGSAIEVHEPGGHVLVWSSDAGSTAHLLEAAAESRSADLWLWRLVAGDTYRGKADPSRSQELFYVLAGALTLTADDRRVVVPVGASGRLRSDRPYSYANHGDVPVEFVRTVVLAPGPIGAP
jgi:transcriptional regulator with XRE-family HTH domain